MILDDFGEMAFGRRPVFFHKGHASESQFQIRLKVVPRKITLEPPTLVAIGIHYQDRRGPHRVEAVKVSRVFFDVDVKRNEILFDVRRQTGVIIRLSFEPSTRPSGRSGAEVNKQRFVLIFGVLQCRVGVGDPID
jgi:hypothetical protein